MKFFLSFFCFLFLLGFNVAAQQTVKPLIVETGVSENLANGRSAVISNIQYELQFSIPANQNADIDGVEKLNFNFSAINEPLQLDFKQRAENVKSIVVNGKKIAIDARNEHLIIAAEYLRKNANEIEIYFVAGNESLNRNAEYLYALFVPDHARTAFPCFDQPDLKARFLLTLKVPNGWKALANGKEKDSVTNENQTTYHFANSDVLPTYLFSFTAGKYSLVKQLINKRNYEFLHRETDQSKLSFSIDSIFKAHADAIGFLEEWTAIPFPFQKTGFVAIPDFQFGGMEHPGEVQYKASSLFLDDGATKDQFIARSNLISHETAHMWFGDLVTMKWFNDVWMKEVFANFMADKVTEKMMGAETFNLKFLQDHYPAAYGVDRTFGANPIRQQLDNLQDAGSMYGNIIYHKAPIMMRQLELLMGSTAFQKGIRAYLQQYAYKNATWNDLIAILSKHTSIDLYQWNKVWVNQPGRPVFDYTITYKNNLIDELNISQKPEFGNENIWPQLFDVKLIYADSVKILHVNMNAAKVIIASNVKKPLFILFNSNAIGYGLFPVDKEMGDGVFKLALPLERATAYINAYEDMLAARSFKPKELLQLFAKGIEIEKNEMNLKLLTGYISTIYWTFLLPKQRMEVNSALEQVLWKTMELETPANIKKILFKTYQDVYLSTAAGNRMYEIWKNQQAPTGLRLSEDDYISLALTLALKSDTPSMVLNTQKDRVANVERKNRINFLMPALSTDVKERDAFFDSLADRKNRQKEAWVGSALAYLNHPLRQQTSIAYLSKSLALVAEIQKTGDIFFPQSWLGAVFGNYQNKEAYQIVTDFLEANPNYNLKLKGKILQATDNLYRAQKLLAN